MFKKDHYQVIRNVISKDMANLCYRYLLNKRRVFKFLHENKLISAFNDHWGQVEDAQVPDAWANYDDVLMTTLLVETKAKIEKEIDMLIIQVVRATKALR
jgi:hypothetical protein